MAVFTARTGISYAELADLLTQQLSAAELAADVGNSFFINATGEGLKPLAIAVDTTNPKAPFQKLINTSDKRFDRLDRFIRLWRRFGGSFAELDWAMKAAQATEISAAFLTNLATVAGLRSGGTTRWDELAALQFDVKTIGKGDGRAPADLFDRVFNNPRLLDGRDPYQSSTPFDPSKSYPWVIAETTGDNGKLRDRLAAALALSNPDVAKLGAYVAALQGGKPGELSLNLTTLSELYRLALSARLLKQDLASFFLVAGLTFYPANDPAQPPKDALPPTLATFEKLRSTVAGVRAAPFSLYQLQYIYTAVAGPYVAIGYRPDQINTFINDLAETSASLRLTAAQLVYETIDEDAAATAFQMLAASKFVTGLGISLPKALNFDALSFLFPVTALGFVIPDGTIDPARSQQAFDELVKKGFILQVMGPPAQGDLSSTYTPATPLDFLFVGEPNAVDMRQQVREILDQVRRNVSNTLFVLERTRPIQISAANSGLAEFLDATPEMIALLVTFATGATDVQTYLADLLTPLGNSPAPDNVVKMIALLARANMLFTTLDLTAIEINAVVTSPKNFDIADTTSLTLDGIWSLVAFKGLVVGLGDVNDVIVRCYFEIAPQGNCAGGTGTAALASLTGWPEAEIAQLIALFWPGPVTVPPGWKTVAGLVILNRVFALSKTTALGTEGLSSVARLAGTRLKKGVGLDPDAWTAFTAAAAAMKAALNARFGSEAFDVLYGDIEATLLTQQRDALNGFAVWVLGAEPGLEAITSIPRLSEYLLIDLEMCGCNSTSYIAQGIASLQAYMQRARMNLEPGVVDIRVPATWWSWLTAYRVWEANRRSISIRKTTSIPSCCAARRRSITSSRTRSCRTRSTSSTSRRPIPAISPASRNRPTCTRSRRISPRCPTRAPARRSGPITSSGAPAPSPTLIITAPAATSGCGRRGRTSISPSTPRRSHPHTPTAGS